MEAVSKKKGKAEDPVDKKKLQKYHRGKQNRFKVSEVNEAIVFVVLIVVESRFRLDLVPKRHVLTLRLTFKVFAHQHVKDKKLRGKLKSYESQHQQAATQAARSEILLTEQPG